MVLPLIQAGSKIDIQDNVCYFLKVNQINQHFRMVKLHYTMHQKMDMKQLFYH